jgi:hypothetical protein
MTTCVRRALLGSLLSISLFGAIQSNATAQTRTVEYWPGYWRWYDQTYRPYYHRYYGPTVYEPVPQPYYNGSGYYTPYYTAPTPAPYYAPGVRVGRVRFGWW